MKRMILFFITGVIVVILSALVLYLSNSQETGIQVVSTPAKERLTLFPNQCIDTMKVSRDKARSLSSDPKAQEIIASQVEQVASLGATCIAIGTPYDEEFIPYMQMWVNAAQKSGLSVWFRGNWSSWEGWFSYRKNLTPEEHVKKTEAFIISHPDLFRDGDIFSPIVEPENGGPFHPVNTNEKTVRLREFIRIEQVSVKKAFKAIGKDVTTSWISMSGGVAKSVIDKQTVESIDNTVTLDHYVSNVEGMTEYITLFSEPLKTKVVLGEFGAPIPDLNGEMNDDEQNAFVEALLWEIYGKRNVIEGINYWTLTESSTALLTTTGARRPVAETLKKFYVPGELNVRVINEHGRALGNVIISLQDDTIIERTDRQGRAKLMLPQGTYSLQLITTTGKILNTPITVIGNDIITVTGVFEGI